jgi:hypothetical protein
MVLLAAAAIDIMFAAYEEIQAVGSPVRLFPVFQTCRLSMSLSLALSRSLVF